MLRSLYSGVSGMKSNQVKMDVIGNNIANVNTTAFKSSRVKFQETLSNTMSTALGPDTSGKGAKNPKQVGLGTTVSSIDTMTSDGVQQPTGREFDFAIEREGFFVVSSNINAATGAPNTVSYTRDGSFYKDSDGNLVNSSGNKVLGYEVDINGISKDLDADGTTSEGDLRELKIPTELVPAVAASAGPPPTTAIPAVTLETFNVDSSGLITAIGSDQNSYKLGRIAIAKFTNQEGLTKEGANTYGKTANSAEPMYGKAGENSFGIINQGVLEVSNVDLANEFTEMIITSRAYQANSRSITTSDEMLQELLSLKR
ncbi:flagellar hook-basal body complex protein [Clostridium grantii]|uniref:Flagellar hook protein FlgE n=1 Tax=Clostridium grantii DSM 8605 TaxID=1121316 RepID=A0A1M5XJ10_9CLOT|nr:flagellar hook-basal body complex protein [Clostridium grantii]SHH99855.1 flagellar hook protein FlgE [Clostridium grantii DSM 8605]